MTPWTPTPVAVADDADLLIASPAVQALVLRLSLRARDGRIPVRGAPEAAAVALCGGAAWAAAAFRSAVDDGFIEVTDDGLTLAWEWPTLRTEAPSVPEASNAGAVTSPDRREALARLKALFSKYKRKTCEERVAWLKDEPGQHALNRLGLSYEDALPLAEAAGRKGGRFGRERTALVRGGNPTPEVTTDGGNHGGNVTSAAVVTTEVTAVSPHTPLPEKKNNKNDDVARARTEVTHGGNRSGTTEVTDPSQRTPDHPFVAALVAAGGLVEPDYETARQLEDVLARAGVTLDLAAAWGKALATPPGRKISWPWLRSPDAPITAHFLRSADLTKGHEPWSRVGDGFSVWRAWDTKRRRAHAKAATPSPPTPSFLPPSEVQAAARAWRESQRNMQPSTPEKIADG